MHFTSLNLYLRCLIHLYITYVNVVFPVDWRYQLEDVHGMFCPNYDNTETK